MSGVEPEAAGCQPSRDTWGTDACGRVRCGVFAADVIVLWSKYDFGLGLGDATRRGGRRMIDKANMPASLLLTLGKELTGYFRYLR